jgi:hypothetical protein
MKSGPLHFDRRKFAIGTAGPISGVGRLFGQRTAPDLLDTYRGADLTGNNSGGPFRPNWESLGKKGGTA